MSYCPWWMKKWHIVSSYNQISSKFILYFTSSKIQVEFKKGRYASVLVWVVGPGRCVGGGGGGGRGKTSAHNLYFQNQYLWHVYHFLLVHECDLLITYISKISICGMYTIFFLSMNVISFISALCIYLISAQILSYCLIYSFNDEMSKVQSISWYSEIPLLRPPKMKTSYLLKNLIAKF